MNFLSITILLIIFSINIAMTFFYYWTGANLTGFHILAQIFSYLVVFYLLYRISIGFKYRILNLYDRLSNEKKSSREQRKLADSIFQDIPCAVAAITADFKIMDINRALTELTGTTMQKAVGQKCYCVFGNGEICPDCPTQKALQTGQVHRNAKLEINRHDTEIFIEQTAIPILRDDGSVKYVLEIVLDATEKTRLQKENDHMFMEMVNSFAQLIESRDVYTGEHSTGVKEIAVGIGRQMNLPLHTINTIAVSAMLHDIGKIGIPESILNKPGKLTEQEFAVIKRHPEIGYETLKKIKPLSDVADAVLYHHERYDGLGYPGLKTGTDIPLVARILCVADVFEAITSDRVYRNALSLEEALLVMYSGKNTYFDPEILTEFFNYLSIKNEEAKMLVQMIPIKYRSRLK